MPVYRLILGCASSIYLKVPLSTTWFIIIHKYTVSIFKIDIYLYSHDYPVTKCIVKMYDTAQNP